MSATKDISRFNLYDLFSTFLPGSTLLLGIVLPHPSIITSIGSLSLAGLVVGAIISFVLGLLLQAVGGSQHSVGEEFSTQLTSIVESDEGDDEVTAIDVRFIEYARKYFELDVDFEDWKHLYRMVLSEIDGQRDTRALRLQALFLAMRGLMTALILLTITSSVYLFLQCRGLFQTTIPSELWPVVILLCAIGSILAKGRMDEFKQDTVEYMIIEFREPT